MTAVALPHTIIPGTNENAAHVQANDEALRDGINGGLDGDNLTTTAGQVLGISSSAVTRSGMVSIAAQQSRTSATYGLMTDADRVQNIELPTGGLLFVLYQAEWWETVADAARAAIFVGSDQLRRIGASTDAAPVVQEASKGGGTLGVSSALGSTPAGLGGQGGLTAFTRGTTLPVVAGGHNGQAYGPTVIEAPAGTYTVSIQFKASSGDVVVRNRKLRVWTRGF